MLYINSSYDIDKRPFIIVNNETVIEISQSFTNMLEYSVEELLNRNIADVFRILRIGPDIDIENISNEAGYFLFTRSLEVKFVNISVINDGQEKLCIFSEKPDYKLEVKYPFADTLCSDNYYGIGIYSMPDITLLKANEKHINIFDDPYNKKKNCIGKHIREFSTGFKGSTFEEAFNIVLSTGKSHNYEECMHESRNRGITYWNLSLVPLYENGKIKYCVAMTADITEQVLQKKEIRYHQEIALQAEREKNEALEKAIKIKDEFLSLISHEFRTPLNGINTAMQAINYVCVDDLSDRLKKYLNIIKRNTFRQLRLINNLLDITRADAGRMKIHKKNIDIVFLTNSIVESVHTYSSQKGVMVKFVSSIGKKIIGIDDEKYERILLNLLSNAIKFTPEGKSIVVKLRSMKDSICIEVKDKGIGIPENKIDLIFEKFGQVDSSLSRSAEGTGIGLALVKKFVEALGGSISVRSKVGRGTTFTILLPGEMIVQEHSDKEMIDLPEKNLIQTIKVEFSDII